MLWFDSSDASHYPPFVDKALKLFNLKQVAYEIETSVMSRVSCTACKAGKINIHSNTSELVKYINLYLRSCNTTQIKKNYVHFFCIFNKTYRAKK